MLPGYLRKASITSAFSGNRPALCFEKTSFPSAMTSKTPLLPFLSSAFTPNCPEISAARLVALGR